MTTPIPFTVVVPTAYGPMLVNRYDINQTNALFKTGRAPDHEEIVMLAELLRTRPPNPRVVDVGANFGCYALGLAPAVGPLGDIHAFEPQRILFNMLAGSVALNSLTRVYCHNAAVGAREGTVEIPQFDYGKPMNFGSIEFAAEQREQLSQPRGRDPDRVERVPLSTLDRFGWGRLDLLKIDTEGMENEVLDGALETIRRCRPILYIEFLKVDREALRERILAEGYTVRAININFLGIPSEFADRIPASGG